MTRASKPSGPTSSGSEGAFDTEVLTRAILEQAAEGILVCDPNGIIVRASRAGVALAGRNCLHEQFVTAFPMDVEGIGHAERLVARVLAGEAFYAIDARLSRPGSEVPRWLLVSAVPLRSTEELGCVISLVDITARRLAEGDLRASEERYRALVDLAPDAIVVHQAGRFVYANSAALRLYGATSPDELAGRAVLDLIHPDDRTLVGDRILDVTRGGSAPLRALRILRLDGTLVFTESTASLIEYHRADAVQVILRDVTERIRTDEALRELSATLAYHVDHSPLAIIEWGPDMRLVRWAGAAEKVFGWKAEEVLGKRMDEFRWVYEDDAAQVAAVSGQLQSGADTRRFSLNRNYRKNGSVAYCEWHNSSLVDATGRMRSILSLVLDVTDRTLAETALRESERRHRRFYESGLVGVIYWDMAGRITDANDRFLEMTGYSREELTTGTIDWMAMTPPEHRQLDEASMAELKASGVNRVPFEKEYIRKDGTRVPVLVAGAMLDEARREGVAFVLDVSKRKQAEDDLRRSLENLEQFAYVASHDLQEPLRMMASYSQLLERRYRDRLDADAREFIGFIVEGATRMQRLLSDLLAYSRVGRGDRRPQRVDCNAALRLAVESLGPRIEESGAVVTSDVLPVVTCAESELVQLFQNLVGNAIKFRGPETPRVHVGAVKEEGEWVVWVKDNGIGIEPRYADRIFQVFQRLHTREEYPGTGIGLAICKKVVESLGGRIWFESEPGKGSTFRFTVPARGETADE